MGIDASENIRDRTFTFGCDVTRLSLAFAPAPGVRNLIEQLLKAGTSVGANLEEAKASSSKREFLKYVQISLRESREAVYWLRICAAIHLGPSATVLHLIDEGGQIARILAAIVVKTKRRLVLSYGAVVLAVAFPVLSVVFLNFAFCILHFELRRSVPPTLKIDLWPVRPIRLRPLQQPSQPTTCGAAAHSIRPLPSLASPVSLSQ